MFEISNTNARKTPLQMGTYHMAQDSRFEPQRNNNFEVQIVGLDNLTTVHKEQKVSADAGSNFTLSIASFKAPSMSVQVIPISYGNNKVKFAGVPEFENSDIVFNDFIGVDVANILQAWWKKVYNMKTQQVGRKVGGYARNGYLIEYDPEGGQARQWQLVNCWPSSFDMGDFAQEGNAFRTVSITLVYDYAIPLDEN
jgi:hypothetical protein